MNQPECSIGSWKDLGDMYIAAFQGGYSQPGTMNDLNLVIQRPG